MTICGEVEIVPGYIEIPFFRTGIYFYAISAGGIKK